MQGKKPMPKAMQQKQWLVKGKSEIQPADDNTQNISELLSQQQSIAGRISGYDQSIGNLYASIENNPEGRRCSTGLMIGKVNTGE